MASSI
jgi:CRP-like cAMP-binding protein